MEALALIALIFAGASLDWYKTQAAVADNPERELNPVIKWLVKKLGPKVGAAVGIGIPTAIGCILAALFNIKALYFLAGFRSCFAMLQMLVDFKRKA